MIRSLAIALLFAACGGGGSNSDSTTPDADTSMLPLCTGATFDPCTDPSQCMSAMCQPFEQLGITTCTQTCNASTPCPMQNGQPTMCNMKGLCRPNAANACRR